MQSDPIVITGGKNILKSIGYRHISIKRLVEDEGLPAWQEKKMWRAIESELVEWLMERRERFKAPADRL